jgi:type IV pilus assembly protein PilY1
MKINRKKIVAFLAGFLYMACGLSPVWADDTEIYFGNVGGGGAKANLLFILDTSTSMDTVDTDSDKNNTQSRLEQMKDSMKLLLQGLTNVNVGLMRFSNPGGPILYPVTNLDSIATGTGVVGNKIINAGDDGYQHAVDNTLVMGRTGLELGAQAPSGTTIVSFSTSIGSASSGSSNDASTDLQTGTSKYIDAPLHSPTDQDDGSHQRVNGLRFTSVAIPVGAVITRAYLQFQVYDTGVVDTAPLQFDILGEAVDVGSFNIATGRQPGVRIASTTNILPQFAGVPIPVVWSMNTLPSADDAVRSTDIGSIVQAIVNNANWKSGNAMTLLYRKSASSTSKNWLTFSSFDRTGGAPPKLVVEYYTKTPTPVPSAVTTALRFQSVFVPKGVTITGAHLNFVAQRSDTNAAAVTIKAEASGNSPEITSSAKIIGRTATSASVNWSTASGTLTNWVLNNTYSTPDLKAVVQEVVSRSDWCGGNAMTLLLSGTLGQRIASAQEDGSSLAPQLSIQYDPNSVPETNGCVNTSTIAQINAGNDDVEEWGTSQALNDSGLELAAVSKNNKGVAQKVGFLFRNIQVPQGQTITSAYLQFNAREENSQVMDGLTISIENTAQPVDYSDTKKLSPRPITGSVAWKPASWAKNGTYESPDIKSLLQAVVNKTDWDSGNNLSLVITGTSTNTSNIRRPHSYDSSPSKSAKLIINYQNSLAPKMTVKELLINTVDDLVTNGSTPIQDTMYEAAMYFAGSNVVYGSQRGGSVPAVSTTAKQSGPFAATRVSHSKSFTNGTVVRPTGCTEANLSDPNCAAEKIVQANVPGANGQYSSGAKYISPVTVSCQVNHVILLTDGEANSPHSSELARTLTGLSSCAEADTYKDADNKTRANGQACVAEIATWLKDGDMAPTVPGKQGVITDTVAFHLGGTSFEARRAVAFLNDVAKKGGSLKQGVYQAENALELSNALGDIVGQVSSSNTSFVAAGTAVNAFNRTVNRDELYFSVFQPSATPRWPGNVKKYKSEFVDNVPTILDKNGVNAVDSNGFFAAGSSDFWNSGAADGPDVTKGGAGSLITSHAARKVYTYLDDIASPSKSLTSAVNNFATTNAELTAARMDFSTPASYTLADLIDWTRGKDVQNVGAPTGTRFLFADPLHSRPVAVTYGGTEANPDISVFVSTNSGFLHAIDNSTGAEQFAFIPRELLPLQKLLFENLASTPHPSGLDGTITTWVKDPDADGVVLNGSNQLQANNGVYLYVGMRRGGRNYYALDVSDRSNPKILWTIKGGVTTGFNNLGQTWSQPLKGRVKVGNTVRDVLIFAGGYASNNNQDNSTQRDNLATDTDGNAVYIVDATDGSLIWSGSSASGSNTVFTDMKYSIPSNIVGADINGDGLMDVLFVGDMGGQLWRFDVKNGQAASSLVTGGVIADLNAAGGSATPANNRRFYHAPAMFIGEASGKAYLGVAIGSGYRAHPLNNTTEDRFYMIKSELFKAPTSYVKLTEANLYDATENLIGEGTSEQQTAALVDLNAANGWYLRMDNQGEKVLSTPLIVEGQLFFNTYQPGAPPNTDPCAPATGINRSYTMSAFDASPVNDTNGMIGLQASDRMQIVKTSGIIDQQRQIVKMRTSKDAYGNIVQESVNVIQEGSDLKEALSKMNKGVHRIYWYENRGGG